MNGELEARPELVNSAPYTEGWLIEVESNSEAGLDAALEQTLDAAGYREITEG